MRNEHSARSPPGSPRPATRRTSSRTSSTRPPGSSARNASGSTSWARRAVVRATPFSEQDGLAEALAHQAAIAIRNSRLIEALERSASEIRRRAGAEQELREIGTTITAIRDPAELLQQVTDAARRLLSGERSQLDIVDPETGLIRWTNASGEGRFGEDLPGTREGVPAEIGINAPAIAERG